MLKLSQRAWNNVIIISTLMLILLFNFSSNFLNDGDDSSLSRLTLIPAEMTITTIAFHQGKIERIGQGWRSTSRQYDHESLASLVEQWQLAEVRSFVQDTKIPTPAKAGEKTVKVWFAGQAEPITYQFIELADKTLVTIDSALYELYRPSYHNLRFPE